MSEWIFAVCCGVPLAIIALHTTVRLARHFSKFPIPQALTQLIDHPLRRKFIQPPDKTAIRHGIRPGMCVLEVGPGTGTYTLAAARRVGPEGKAVAIDIEPKIIERLNRRIRAEGVVNLEARVADVYDLPFDDGIFDLIFMITVIGEIPDVPRALAEFHRVLKPDGRLVFSELFPDPDYPLANALTRRVESEGFRLKEKIGNFFYYTLIFKKT